MENPHIPDAILGSWLYLGSKHTRERRDILDELNIQCVMDFSQLPELQKFEHIDYVVYDVVDNEAADIAKFFDVCDLEYWSCFLPFLSLSLLECLCFFVFT
jgi:hypothetical protein